MRFTADFETITDPDDCRVWAFAVCDIDNPDYVFTGNSIDGFMEWMNSHAGDSVYFHNLKFDGEFILHKLLSSDWTYVEDRKFLSEKTFTTLINSSGAFYSIELCFKKYDSKKLCLRIYDSLKILPLSVDAVAKSFKLPISKLSIDYNEHRPIGHELTVEELEYITNDVRIMAMALKNMFDQNLTAMTQGSNAMMDFKRIISKKNFERWFPVLEHDKEIRQSYKGGWTYANPIWAGKDIGKGIVLDVNSLYPSRMYNCMLPFGEPIFYEGKYVPDKIFPLYVQMIRCCFDIKPEHLPSIGLKNLRFLPTEYVESSGVEPIALCLTSVDLELMFEQYDVYYIEYIAGWKFKASNQIFKEYIDKWIEVKNEATLSGNPGLRTIAKLMLNALYGKFAVNPSITRKHPTLAEGKVKYITGSPEEIKPVYVAMSAFITSYARALTIRSAQSVFHRFLYADTDSLHLIGTEIPDNLEVDNVKLGAWDHEATFERARFLRTKCYIEEIGEDLKVTCSGMPSRCHKYVTWENFKFGTTYEGKLVPKHVVGGIVLKEDVFTLRE